jgi:hypothetical protein
MNTQTTAYTKEAHGFRMEVIELPLKRRTVRYTTKLTNLTTGETFVNDGGLGGWDYWTAVGIVKREYEVQLAKQQ